jgi:hypothetical protein
MDKLRAKFHRKRARLPPPHVIRIDSTADSARRFEANYPLAGLRQQTRGRKACHPGAQHKHINLAVPLVSQSAHQFSMAGELGLSEVPRIESRPGYIMGA